MVIVPAFFPDQNMGSLLVCGLVVCVVMVCLGIISQQECRDAVLWDVYVTIACAFGIGLAMKNSVRNQPNLIYVHHLFHLVSNLTLHIFFIGACNRNSQWISQRRSCAGNRLRGAIWCCISSHLFNQQYCNEQCGSSLDVPHSNGCCRSNGR